VLTPKQNYSPREINVRRNDKNISTRMAAIFYLNFLNLISYSSCTTVYKYLTFPCHQRIYWVYFLSWFFSCILVTSKVQQPSYKHVTVCIFLYKYIFWSIN